MAIAARAVVPHSIVARIALYSLLSILLSTNGLSQDLGIRPIRELTVGGPPSYALAVDSNERLVAVGGAGRSVRVYDMASGKQLATWEPSNSVVVDLAFVPNKPLVVSASYPNALTLFDVQKNERVWQIQCKSPPTRIAVSPDGTKIGVASMVGRAMIYDAVSGNLVAGINHDSPASNGVAFAADSKDLFVGTTPMRGKAGKIQILRCDAATGQVKNVIGGYEGTLTRIRISPSGRRLVSFGRQGVINLWDLDADRLQQSWALDLQKLQQGALMDDDLILAGSLDQFQVLRAGEENPIEVHASPGGVNHVAPLRKRGLLVRRLDDSMALLSFDKTLLKLVASKMNPDDAEKPVPDSGLFTEQDNQPPEQVDLDGLLSAQDLNTLVGKPILLKLRSGLLISDANLESLLFDRTDHGLRFIKYKLTSGRSVTVKATDLYRMKVGNRSLALRYYAPKKQLFLYDAKVADLVASGRLAATNNALRATPTDQEQSQATGEHREFLARASTLLKDVGVFRIEETQSTLIFTDLPDARISLLERFVDTMNGRLNQIFGVPQSDSVWRGKAVLCVFSSVKTFAAFEERVMENRNHGGRAGVRESATRFLQTAIIGKSDANMMRAICWGYSLGFCKRLVSDARGEPWLNMGIANAMQYAVLPEPQIQRTQRNRVIAKLKEHGSLLGLLRATQLEQDRWPICSQLVQFLLAADPLAFGQLFQDVKRGVEAEDALKRNFAMDFADLATAYGASIGIPQLTP